MSLPPAATPGQAADAGWLAQVYGPTLQRYRTGPLPPLADGGAATADP
jgi:hypothetical protein